MRNGILPAMGSTRNKAYDPARSGRPLGGIELKGQSTNLSKTARRKDDMKRYPKTTAATLVAILLLAPGLLWAAGGGASELVVVADTRVVSNSFLRYVADLYNTNVTLFATWAVVLTAMTGAVLGSLMDFIMKRTGIDLSSRKIVEH
jgi:hypothetical protein